jgi:Mg-chelatase subunit ChlD
LTWFNALVLATALAGQSQAASDTATPAGQSTKAAATSAKDPKPAQDQARPAKKAAAKPAEKSPAKAATPIKSGPQVLTQSEMNRPRSPFLMPPGSDADPADRYSGPVDWRDIPPWRQASFFGIRAQGRFFVYVIDCSGSMIDDDRFARASTELRRSVMALQSPQQFEVIFYNDESIPMPGGPVPRPADPENKRRLNAWLQVIEPDNGTDPRLSIRQAMSLRPEAVFLLSDGEFPDGTSEAVARSNTRKIPIHCVDLSGGEGGDHLIRIARDSGGKYVSRPGSLHVIPESRTDPKKKRQIGIP